MMEKLASDFAHDRQMISLINWLTELRNRLFMRFSEDNANTICFLLAQLRIYVAIPCNCNEIVSE